MDFGGYKPVGCCGRGMFIQCLRRGRLRSSKRFAMAVHDVYCRRVGSRTLCLPTL